MYTLHPISNKFGKTAHPLNNCDWPVFGNASTAANETSHVQTSMHFRHDFFTNLFGIECTY